MSKYNVTLEQHGFELHGPLTHGGVFFPPIKQHSTVNALSLMTFLVVLFSLAYFAKNTV